MKEQLKIMFEHTKVKEKNNPYQYVFQMDNDRDLKFTGSLIGYAIDFDTKDFFCVIFFLYKSIDGYFVCEKKTSKTIEDGSVSKYDAYSSINGTIDFFGDDALAEELYKNSNLEITMDDIKKNNQTIKYINNVDIFDKWIIESYKKMHPIDIEDDLRGYIEFVGKLNTYFKRNNVIVYYDEDKDLDDNVIKICDCVEYRIYDVKNLNEIKIYHKIYTVIYDLSKNPCYRSIDYNFTKAFFESDKAAIESFFEKNHMEEFSFFDSVIRNSHKN
jgi:hypothetical protein